MSSLAPVPSPATPPSTSLPRPPRMPPLPTLAQLFSDNLLGLFESAARQGPIVRLDQAFFRLYQVNDPALVREVLMADGKRYIKGALMRRLKAVTGDGLLINSGTVWKRHRKAANPAFSRRRLAGYGRLMDRAANELMTRWQDLPPGAEVDVHEEMSRATLAAVLRSIFGIEPDDQLAPVSAAIGDLLDVIVAQGSALLVLPRWLPTLGKLRFAKQLTLVNEALDTIIETRWAAIQAGEEGGSDLLAQWLTMRAENARAGARDLSASELRDELMTFLIAGHHSLALGLAWAMHMLTLHPAAAAQVVAEADAWPADQPLGPKDLERFPWTRGAFLEALRLYPQPPILLREAIEDVQLGGFSIKKGDQLLLNCLAVHHDETLWPDPSSFRPLRYRDQDLEGLARRQYLAFGAGSRSCIGRHFAVLEGVQLLAACYRNFHIEPVRRERVKPRFAAMVVPRSPLTVRLTPRSVEAAPADAASA